MNQNLVNYPEYQGNRHGNVLAFEHGSVLESPTLSVKLGTSPDIGRVARPPPSRSDAQVEIGITKTFMFTDIVSSTDLAGSLGDSRWLNVIAWHDRTLRAALSRHGGEEVRHTGDGFFVAFDSAQQAVVDDVVDKVGGAGFEISEAQMVNLKGVTEPVEVHKVVWG